MKIYDKAGAQLTNTEVLSNLPVTSECEHVEELMHDDYVSLSWRDTERYVLPVGSYIIPFPDEGNPTGATDSRYPLKYRLFEEYDPDGRNEQEFEYEPKFQHPIMWLTRIPFVLITGEVTSWADALKKTSWGYTGSVEHIAQFVVDSINWLSAHYPFFGEVFGTGWTTVIDSDLAPSATVDFDGVDIFSGAGLIADAFDCEFHFDFARRQYRLGTMKYDTNIVLKSGDNVGVANISRSKQDFYNAFLIKGSTRNLSQPTDTGENVQLRERLTLDAEDYPDSMMYTDDNGNIITREQFLASGYPLLMKELVFDNIYPKLELYLYNVRERKCWLLDEDGHKVEDSHGELDTDGKRYKSYSKWYIRLAYPLYNANKEIVGWQDYTIGEHSIIDGQTLQLSFLANTEPNAYNSLLIGQGDFDMVYFDSQTTEKEDDDINPAGFTAQAGDYRIVFKDSDGFIIPTTSKGGMYPLPVGTNAPSILNNKATLLNIVVDDNYKKIAQQELETAARRKVMLDRANLNNYTVPSNPVYFEENDVRMHVGQSVTYNDGQDLAGGVSSTLDTHIIKIVTKLDYPFQKEITVGNSKVKTNINMLRDEVDTLAANLGGMGLMNEAEMEQLIAQIGSRYFLSKINDDTARGFIRMIKGLQVGERFVPGLLGEGGVFRREADGSSYIEADKMYIRVKAYFDNVEIRDYKHSSGNRIASSAGARCCRVEYIGSNGEIVNSPADAVLFRCYFRGSDGEDEVRNNFIVGDMAYCHVTSVETASDTPDAKGLNMKHYWRLVVGRNPVGTLTDDGEHWIDLSNRASETITVSGHSYTHAGYQSGSDTPSSQDDIIQLGNIYDTTRQGAIIEFVSGADAPSYQIYQGINDYSLNGKNYIGLGYSSQNARAYLNVYGDAYLGDPNESTYIKYNAGTRQLEIKAKISSQSTIDGETIAQFISENTWTEEQIDALITAETDPLVDAIEEIQKQVDGSIETWFYDGVPTLSNLPASEWDTADEKNKHLGDLYYDNLTGYGYRFKYDELNHQWLWGRITDVDVVKALADAAKAQDTADHKRRVFVVQPTPPYDAGDLWVNATYPTGNTETNDAQSRYYNDVLRCNTSKAEGTTFAIADWSLASKYTDDKALNDFKANQYVQQLTNGTISTNISNAQAAAQAADSRAAALEYIKTALKQDTVIEGGLVLSTLIALRDGSNHIWSGISGTYQSAETGTGYKGHGIAAWYGGAMVDKEVTTTATDYAKSLFRFDGSGYVAGGNLSWDKNGNVTIQGYSINATTLQVGGSNVATQAALANYVTLATDQTISGHKTFGTSNGSYIQIGAIRIVYDQSNNALKIVGSDGTSSANLYATGGVSALGQSSSGGGGIDMDAVWTALGNATSEQINASHLSNALSAYNPTSNFKTINGNSIIGTGNIVIQGGGGTVTAVKVGSTSYSPTDGVVSLPAYPTKASWNYDDTYLKLSGGTLTDALIIHATQYNAYNEGIRIQDAANKWAGITFGATGSTGITPASGEVAWFVAKNPGGKFGITPNTSSSSSGLELNLDGDMKWRNNTVYHTGNLPAYPTKSSWNYDDRYLRIDTNNTYGGVMSFTTSGYGINVGGILGAFSNALLHLYERVNIGSPNGWGSQDAPNYGLSVYGGCSLATNTGSVGIATTSPETKLDVNGIQQIYQRGLDNTAFKNLLLLKAQNSTETGGDNWGDTYPTFGIGFRRYWTSGSNPYGETTCAGIYATISGSWRGGLVFRTKNNQNSGGTHDVTALRLAPSGAATFASSVTVNGSFNATSGSISGYAIIHAGNIGSQSVNYATSSGTSASATQLQYSRTIWGQSFNGTGNVSGAMSSVTSIDSLLYFDTTNNRIGINTSSPAEDIHFEKKNVRLQNTSSNNGIWVELKGVSEDFALCIGDGNTNRGIIDFKRSMWMIYFDASNTYCNYGNFVCSGGVTALSDIRHKSIVENTNITVEQIARMRSVKFLWSDGRDDDNIYVGSIAQDWQSILPEVVLRKDDKDGTLSLNYGVAALVSVITTARKVVDHERRIRELEKENKRLKQMLNAA